MIVVDFETHGIEGSVPPQPVGVAIMDRGRARYYAWGHPSANNATIEEATARLRDAWRSGRPLLFHNAKFDLKVAQHWLGLPIPQWDLVHDTLFLSFLMYPHEPGGLKELAERHLGQPPGERDEVAAWLVEHKVIRAKYSKDTLGANLWRAPGNVVGKYAIGDVQRTLALYRTLAPKVMDASMWPAYDRERKLLPILIANEREGMRLDIHRLERDLPVYESARSVADSWVRKRLRAPTLNVDASEDLAKALFKAKVVTEFVKTPTGKDSTSKKNLTFDMYTDREVARVLQYRGALATLLENSMRPWLAQARGNNGFIATEWNQVKAVDRGTRSGRLSCSRFQNIAKSFDGIEHPTALKLPPLPLVRTYILPDVGGVFVHRDYNQQEFRILAHFEGSTLQEAYQKDPRLDYHVKMQELIRDVSGIVLERRPTKILNFGINYGMGIAKLAVSLGLASKYACRPGCDHKLCKAGMEARNLKAAQRRAVPGIDALNSDLKAYAKLGEPIRTWGGRLYHCEPPKTDAEGRIIQTYEYKMLNYLIQCSAADCTKEAIVRYHDHPRKDARFLVTVHDEINVSAHSKVWGQQSEVLREVMESIEFDVPMLTDGKHGPNWGELK